jgi:stage V sporulation protein SpoVS
VTPKNQKALSILRTPEQSEAQATANAALNPAVNAAAVVDTYQANLMGNEHVRVSRELAERCR